jgi:hypothetical protein
MKQQSGDIVNIRHTRLSLEANLKNSATAHYFLLLKRKTIL